MSPAVADPVHASAVPAGLWAREATLPTAVDIWERGAILRGKLRGWSEPAFGGASPAYGVTLRQKQDLTSAGTRAIILT